MDLSIRVKKFIDREWDRKSPLLLGYSGGFDSKALLHILLKTAAAGSIHLAHVDHGWREESAREALLLAEEAASLNIPFHTTRLSLQPTKNREEAGRLARFLFFRSLFDQIPFQALFLAHHADDVAETALKRLLEGAHLPNLGGMIAVAQVAGVLVWRPLLGVKKEDIIRLGLSGLDDATNRCPQFLRSRLRSDILPTLATSFGKEVSTNLALFSERAFELKQYLDRKVASLEWKEGPWGRAVYLEGVERIEARHFLLKEINVGREIVEGVLDHLGRSNLRFGPCIIDRGWVFLLSNWMPRFGQEIELKEGGGVSGNWVVRVENITVQTAALDWQNVWQGEFVVDLPDGILTTDKVDSFEPYRLSRLPPFLRPHIPSLGGRNIFTRFVQPRWRVRFFIGITHSSLRE